MKKEIHVILNRVWRELGVSTLVCFVGLVEDADLVPCGGSPPPVLLGNLAPSSGLLDTCRENLKHTEVNHLVYREERP